MAGALEGLEFRFGDVPAPQFSSLHRQEFVVFAPDQEGRHGEGAPYVWSFEDLLSTVISGLFMVEVRVRPSRADVV